MTSNEDYTFTSGEELAISLCEIALSSSQQTTPQQEASNALPVRYRAKEKLSEKTDRLPPPPRWLGSAAYWFRLSFAVVVLISSLLGLAACGVNAQEISWQPGSKYFERSLLEQMVEENTSLTPSESTISQVQVHRLTKQPQLTLVNFNNAELCGQLGCLYAIYLETASDNTKVFSRNLRSELPKGVALIEVSDRSSNDLPCLILNQLVGSELTKLTLCYDGSKYQNIDAKTVEF